MKSESVVERLLGSAGKLFQKKFLYDVLKTFIGVLLAFWVNEWKMDKQSNFTQKTVLEEIQKELVLDIKDMELNLEGHKQGKTAARFFWKALHNQDASGDSLAYKYTVLLRNFVSVQHSAAYESVKSRGLEIIKDDSLRSQIVNIFDFDLESLEKVEEQYAPHDFFRLYFDKLNEQFLPYIDIDAKGVWTFKRPLYDMPEANKQLVKNWLYRLIMDRQFMISNYEETIAKMKELQKNIDLKVVKK